jgi:hypothetical protein
VALKNCTLSRYGNTNDGGYLICANLIQDLGSAYSYGVGPNDDFACDLSRKHGVPVHQYDCFDPARPVCDGGTFVFHNECIGPKLETSEQRRFDTLANQISGNGDAGKRLIVKIDVEAAEWDAITATPDEVLTRIDQIPMELHGVDDARFLEVVRRLKQHFHLVNVNFSNWSCTPGAEPLPGLAYQVLFVNKRLAAVDSEAPVPAPRSPLNAPDNALAPDCQIGGDDVTRFRQIREALYAEVQPVALRNCALSRFGSAHDGGYLMCGNLIRGVAAAYSYGIGPNDDWGCAISTQFKVPTHQYDCFDPARPVCTTGRFVFHNECVGAKREQVESRTFDTLAGQIASNGDAGSHLVVKIDVEGAEWDALMATPDAVLQRIDQLAMELHGVNDAKFVATVKRLKQHFHVVNLNVNNHSCTPYAAPFTGWAYQVLLVNKRIGVLDTLDDPAAPPCGKPPAS